MDFLQLFASRSICYKCNIFIFLLKQIVKEIHYFKYFFNTRLMYCISNPRHIIGPYLVINTTCIKSYAVKGEKIGVDLKI